MINFAISTISYLYRQWCNRYLWLLLGVLLCVGSFSMPAHAVPLNEVKVSLGNSADELKFFPNHLQFVAGERYKLVLDNPSSQKHYFTAKDFADSIWTQKVEAGKVEIKGAIHELELKPGGEAEWFFVPLKSGDYALRCTIPGHAEAGMVGEIIYSKRQVPRLLSRSRA